MPARRRDLERLVRDELGPHAAAADVDTLVARAAGDPLFARELARTALAHAQAGDRHRGFPLTIGGALMERVRMLDAHARTTLALAALCGPRVDVALLADLAERPADDVRAHLRAACALRLVDLCDDAGETVVFTNDHLCETIEADLLIAERRPLYRRILDVLAARGDGDATRSRLLEKAARA